MKAYDLSIGAVILRFYFMMLVVFIAGFSGIWLIAFLALPILVSIMAGIKFTSKAKTKEKSTNTKRVNISNKPEIA